LRPGGSHEHGLQGGIHAQINPCGRRLAGFQCPISGSCTHNVLTICNRNAVVKGIPPELRVKSIQPGTILLLLIYWSGWKGIEPSCLFVMGVLRTVRPYALERKIQPPVTLQKLQCVAK
jgi:hypothetical protein